MPRQPLTPAPALPGCGPLIEDGGSVTWFRCDGAASIRTRKERPRRGGDDLPTGSTGWRSARRESLSGDPCALAPANVASSLQRDRKGSENPRCSWESAPPFWWLITATLEVMLRGMSVLVTGGGCFIGSHLTARHASLGQGPGSLTSSLTWQRPTIFARAVA
jgi:hypothetical protein